MSLDLFVHQLYSPECYLYPKHLVDHNRLTLTDPISYVLEHIDIHVASLRACSPTITFAQPPCLTQGFPLHRH